MENKTEIIITVSGKASSGKSRMTFLLKEFLKEKGFDIEFHGGLDFKKESDFDVHMSENIDISIEHIIKTRKIILQEKQLPRK